MKRYEINPGPAAVTVITLTTGLVLSCTRGLFSGQHEVGGLLIGAFLFLTVMNVILILVDRWR